jgi:hypothetical protein
MARPKNARSVAAVPVAEGEPKVKMVQAHPGFIEPDVVAAQNATDEARFDGPNPYPKGTARYDAWEHLKNASK